jgi:hypothetical protein
MGKRNGLVHIQVFEIRGASAWEAMLVEQKQKKE